MNVRTWMLAGLLGFAFLQGCGEKNEEAGTGATEKFDSPWACEEHWMVAGTVKDLQGMAKLGGAGIGTDAVVPAKAARTYQVGGVALKMSPSCWDLASYQPLLKGVKIAPQTPAEPAPDLLHDLLTPTAKVLQKANKTVSARIKETPAAALVHEEAAFLLGVFGIRENAREFGDLRPLIGRMTAHLVMAEQLRTGGEPSLTGRWARVLYDFHAGRPKKAREAMNAIASESDSGRWKRVVELLITGDWRRTGDLDNPSLAEAIAHARALHAHLGVTEMMEFVGDHKELQGTPEWSRALAGPGRSVEEGHLAMRSSIGMEFIEIGEIFPIGEDPSPAKIAGFLADDTPSALITAKGGPQVISDADWAAYFRRHFYVVCGDISRFTERMWGSHEATVEWEKSLLPYCRKLPDAELIEPLLSSREKDFQEDLRKTADYIRSHPERVPMGLWFDYRFPNLNTSAETSMPDQTAWFREVSPPGTAHEPCRRIRYSGIHGNDWVDHIRELHQINPWNSELCYELAQNTGNNPDSVKTAWGDVRDYSKRPLNQSLNGPSLTNVQRIEILRTLVDLDPESGLRLGAALVMENLPDEAIKAYETAFEKASDRVSVSNQSRWMIHYYKSKGQDAKAREVADHNAEVFSASGLESAMALAIAEKDAKRAVKIADDIEERYGNNVYQPIARWFAAGDSKALKQVFPDGMKEVTKEELEAGKPVKGCRIDEASATTRAVGMRPGDVVLAIDGKRVESYQQYLMLLSSTLDPRTRFIYRRGKKIAEIECLLPDRRLQVECRTVGE